MARFSTIASANQDFEIYSKDSFRVFVNFWEDPLLSKPFNLLEYNDFLMMIKRNQTDSQQEALAILTLGNGLEIVSENRLEIYLSPFNASFVGLAFYDIEISNGVDKVTILKGQFNSLQDTTEQEFFVIPLPLEE